MRLKEFLSEIPRANYALPPPSPPPPSPLPPPFLQPTPQCSFNDLHTLRSFIRICSQINRSSIQSFTGTLGRAVWSKTDFLCQSLTGRQESTAQSPGSVPRPPQRGGRRFDRHVGDSATAAKLQATVADQHDSLYVLVERNRFLRQFEACAARWGSVSAVS